MDKIFQGFPRISLFEIPLGLFYVNGQFMSQGDDS